MEFPGLRFNDTVLSCFVIKQINDKVLIIGLCRVSGEGAIEIIMVGSPGVLIVRVPAQAPRRIPHQVSLGPENEVI